MEEKNELKGTSASSIYACKILVHQDPYCNEYLKAYGEKKILL